MFGRSTRPRFQSPPPSSVAPGHRAARAGKLGSLAAAERAGVPHAQVAIGMLEVCDLFARLVPAPLAELDRLAGCLTAGRPVRWPQARADLGARRPRRGRRPRSRVMTTDVHASDYRARRPTR